MKTGAAVQEAVEPREGLTMLPANRDNLTLSTCVRNETRYYLRNLDGYEINDLHRIFIEEVERPLIETVLDHTRGNQTRAARLLGMSRSTLRKKMAQLGVQRQD